MGDAGDAAEGEQPRALVKTGGETLVRWHDGEATAPLGEVALRAMPRGEEVPTSGARRLVGGKVRFRFSDFSKKAEGV